MVENRAIQVNQNGEDPTRCRYKTGRCINARVLKPNGTLLLLCEFHRNQQNRTKKRSDMKYRQDRAKKRLVGRHHQSPDDAAAASVSSIAIEMARTTCVVAMEHGGASNAAAALSPVNSKRRSSSNVESAFHPTKRLKPCKRDDTWLPAALMPQSKGLEYRAVIARSSSSSTTIEPNNQIRRVFETLHAQELHRRHEPMDASSVLKTDSITLSEYPLRAIRSSANDHRPCDLDDLDETSSFLGQSCSSIALDQRWPPDDVQLLEYFIL